jgi:hypothetical protein
LIALSDRISLLAVGIDFTSALPAVFGLGYLEDDLLVNASEDDMADSDNAFNAGCLGY